MPVRAHTLEEYLLSLTFSLGDGSFAIVKRLRIRADLTKKLRIEVALGVNNNLTDTFSLSLSLLFGADYAALVTHGQVGLLLLHGGLLHKLLASTVSQNHSILHRPREQLISLFINERELKLINLHLREVDYTLRNAYFYHKGAVIIRKLHLQGTLQSLQGLKTVLDQPVSRLDPVNERRNNRLFLAESSDSPLEVEVSLACE